MQPRVPMSEVLTSSGSGWVLTLASVLAVITAGFAVRTAHRLFRRSAPELVVLLNQSAAFYARWPEDRLASAPRTELVREAARCRRIVELLEGRTSATADSGASRGTIAGLKSWIALLGKRIEEGAELAAGPAYA
jgi:hypothetical protein